MRISSRLCTLAVASLVAGAALAQKPGPTGLEEWYARELPVLRNHVQLTSRDDFVRAGEAYFSPDGWWIIFQAVPVPEEGPPDDHYSMYVARLVRSDLEGSVIGIEKPILVSPPKSANTCGWFHPTQPGVVIFASTLGPPAAAEVPGYQRSSGRYRWQFYAETEIVRVDVPAMRGESGPPSEPVALFTRPGYDAEGSLSSDGRFLLYARFEEAKSRLIGRDDLDIYIFDLKTGRHHPLVVAPGYDGGPFFSPDGAQICYRSDRRANNRLQVYVADLVRDEDGVPVAISAEHALTDDEAVNWGPYWYPSGRFLAFATSAMGHDNYEVFVVEPFEDESDRSPPAPSLRRARLTVAEGADVLPAFSHDGSMMMWTSQRGPMVPGEMRPSSQLWLAEIYPARITFDRVVR